MLNSKCLVPWEAIPKFKGPLQMSTLLQHFDAVEEYNLLVKAQGLEPVGISVTLSAPILRRIQLDFARSNSAESKDTDEEDDNEEGEESEVPARTMPEEEVRIRILKLCGPRSILTARQVLSDLQMSTDTFDDFQVTEYVRRFELTVASIPESFLPPRKTLVSLFMSGIRPVAYTRYIRSRVSDPTKLRVATGYVHKYLEEYQVINQVLLDYGDKPQVPKSSRSLVRG